MSNPYFNPEDFGLELIGTATYWGDYCGSDFAVWRELEPTGEEIWRGAPFYGRSATYRYFWAWDGHCSCNGSFDYLSREDLSEGTRHEAAQALTGWVSSMNGGSEEPERPEIVALIEKILFDLRD